MVNFAEKVNEYRYLGITHAYLDFSLKIEKKKKKEITLEHFSELYVIRDILSRFYFLYPIKSEGLWDSEVEEYKNKIIHGLNQEAVKTYKQLAEVLIGSKYFMLLKPLQRSFFVECIDFIRVLEEKTKLASEAGYFYVVLVEEDIERIVDGLLNLFDEVSEEINEFQRIFNRRNV